MGGGDDRSFISVSKHIKGGDGSITNQPPAVRSLPSFMWAGSRGELITRPSGGRLSLQELHLNVAERFVCPPSDPVSWAVGGRSYWWGHSRGQTKRSFLTVNRGYIKHEGAITSKALCKTLTVWISNWAADWGGGIGVMPPGFENFAGLGTSPVRSFSAVWRGPEPRYVSVFSGEHHLHLHVYHLLAYTQV